MKTQALKSLLSEIKVFFLSGRDLPQLNRPDSGWTTNINTKAAEFLLDNTAATRKQTYIPKHLKEFS